MTAGRKTILFTEDSLPRGGAEMVLLQRLDHLDRRMFDVHLLTLRPAGSLLPAAQERADHFACVHRRMGLDVRAIVRLRRYIARHQVDLVQTNQWLDSLYVLLATRGMPVKRVATVHGYDKTWRNVVNQRVLGGFDRIICVSKAQAIDLFKMGFPWRKLAVVHNSCDPSFRSQPCPGGGAGSTASFRLISVAHFRWARDPETLIDAIALLRNQGLNITLHLVGDGDLRLKSACEALVAARGLGTAVRFEGERVIDPEWLAGFDLFVFSSLADTFGLAILEAMSCGLPVLVSDIPPFMELIEHGRAGAYFAAADSASCAAAIEELVQDPERRRLLGEQAAHRAMDFRAEKTTADLEAIYRQLLRQGD